MREKKKDSAKKRTRACEGEKETESVWCVSGSVLSKGKRERKRARARAQRCMCVLPKGARGNFGLKGKRQVADAAVNQFGAATAGT